MFIYRFFICLTLINRENRHQDPKQNCLTTASGVLVVTIIYLEYFHNLLTIKALRRFFDLKKPERNAPQAPALNKRHPKIFNLQ